MPRRTTIELDEDLLDRARKALGTSTTRGTVEEALRRAADLVEDERQERAAKQRRFIAELPCLADLAILSSDEMWR